MAPPFPLETRLPATQGPSALKAYIYCLWRLLLNRHCSLRYLELDGVYVVKCLNCGYTTRKTYLTWKPYRDHAP